MSQILAKFADFSKGEAGWVDKANVPAGFFNGEQIMVYRDGSVGPRSGLVDLAPTGLPSGTLWGLGYISRNLTGGIDYLWIHKGTTLAVLPVYNASGQVLTAQACVAATGAFAANPTGGVTDHVDYSPLATLFTLDGDTAYVADWSSLPASTLTALTGAPGGANIELFNEFLILAGTVANNNRIYYSAPGNFNSWPGANFFDVSGGLAAAGVPAITACRRLRDMLLVWTDVGQLYIITNLTSDPTTVQIRHFMPGDTMSGPEKKAVTRSREGNAWWTRRDVMPFPGDQFFDNPTAVPVSFDGTTRTEYVAQSGYLRQPSPANDRLSRTSAVSGRQERSVVIFDSIGRALVGRGDAWSRHALSGVDPRLVTTGNRGDAFMPNPASTKIYAWQFELDRPPWKFAGSAAELLPYSTIDAVIGQLLPLAWFATPQFRPVNADTVSIDRVEVLFTSHATRDTIHNHFDVYVQQYDAVDADETIETGSYNPPDSHSTAGVMIAGGVTVGATPSFDAVTPTTFDHRMRKAFFLPQDQKPCDGARVLFQNLVGVSIHEVHLYGASYATPRP